MFPLWRWLELGCPCGLTFRGESGDLIQEVVSFQLAVEATPCRLCSRTGKLSHLAAAALLGGETDGGVFEIDLDTQQAEALDFLLKRLRTSG